MSSHDGDRVPVELHIVSDSTGETAQRLVVALEAQFPDQPFVEIRHPRVENVEDLSVAVQQARGRPAVMVYTLVATELRDAMRQLCRRARVHYCDLLGHPIDSISRVAGVAARMEPGARAPLDSAYFKRIEAIEFAVKYDDGVGRGLDEADVVLVGVSRTSKTPLSIYLGYLGQKAANVPVVRGIDLPQELFEIDPAKIVGLTIDAERLLDIRTARVKSMGASRKRYAELEVIYSELEEAATLHRRLGCPVIDVSELSVEETAMRIIRLVEKRKQARGRERRRRAEAVRRARPAAAPAPFRPPPGGRGDLREKGWVPFPRMALWWFLLVLGDLVFYVLLTPIWLGLRCSGLGRGAQVARVADLRKPLDLDLGAEPDDGGTARARSG